MSPAARASARANSPCVRLISPLRLKLLIPAVMVPLLAAGALYTGALSAAAEKVPFLAKRPSRRQNGG